MTMQRTQYRLAGTIAICGTLVLLGILIILLMERSGMPAAATPLVGISPQRRVPSNRKQHLNKKDKKWHPPSTWHPNVSTGACNSSNCKLPQCFCAGTRGPLKLNRQQIPQIVMLTFDDGISQEVYGYIDKLLSKPRLNPNGCPISLTFYLSHTWTNEVGGNHTDYKLVRQLYDKGHEFASHSISHRFPNFWWHSASKKEYKKEFGQQRRNIINEAGIPAEDVKGMRVPFLHLGGDTPFTMMAEEGLTYDATLVTGPHDEGGAWPFTMDHPVDGDYCLLEPCPEKTYPGIWELPLNRWIGVDNVPCWIVDFCSTQPKDKNETLGYIWYNFNRFYYRNRAPFGFHIHVRWFYDNISHFQALGEFLDDLTKLDDVYLVSASQVIEWMKDPQTVDGARSFKPWQRSCEMLGKRVH